MTFFIPFAIFILSAMTANSQKQEISLNHIALSVEDLGKAASFIKRSLVLTVCPNLLKMAYMHGLKLVMV